MSSGSRARFDLFRKRRRCKKTWVVSLPSEPVEPTSQYSSMDQLRPDASLQI
jgi:hypothetical protein